MLALLQYKVFSLHHVDGKALLQEYMSVQHQLKIKNFLRLLGVVESKSIIDESTPPHSAWASFFVDFCRLCFFFF